MRTRTQLGALGQRRLGEMADRHGLVRPEWLECLPPPSGASWDYDEHHRRLAIHSIDWGSEHGTAYVHSVDADPRTFRGVDSGRYVDKLADAAPTDLGKLRAKVERFVSKQRESFGTRSAGKTMLGIQMLASSCAGMHNEGCYWVDATGSYPFYGPWLPHPEPEVFYQ